MDNPDKQLLPGQFVEVAVEVSRQENALFIPEQALIPQADRQFVWKVENGHAMKVEIKTGMRKKGSVEVITGLQAGDKVVTGGHQKIMEGAEVNPVEADPKSFG